MRLGTDLILNKKNKSGGYRISTHRCPPSSRPWTFPGMRTCLVLPSFSSLDGRPPLQFAHASEQRERQRAGDGRESEGCGQMVEGGRRRSLHPPKMKMRAGDADKGEGAARSRVAGERR
uniref:Uncharacterized protein n=1 Tax=Triticum urartu TaxID=4572 RepID=A0A8R7TUN6_TRIUA